MKTRLLVSILLAAASSPALAQDHVRLNGVSCEFPTIADALPSVGPGDTLILDEGWTFDEPTFTIPDGVTIITGGPGCADPTGGETRATIDGGGFWWPLGVPGTSTLNNVVISDYDAFGGTQGGNLTVTGDLTLIDTTVQFGNAPNGAGIYVADGGTVRVQGNSAIWLNEATLDGGGVYVAEGGTLLLEDDSSVWLNEADNGGGVFTEGTTELSDRARLYANTATTSGGGIQVSLSADVLGLDMSCIDCLISHNVAGVNGGGIAVEAPTGVVANVESWGPLTVADNEAVNGGGIYLGDNASSGRLLADDLVVEGNDASLGGGVHVDEAQGETSSIEWYDGEIRDNTAVLGAGVYADGGALAFIATKVVDNTASGSGGGLFLGAYTDRTASAVLWGTKVGSNHADNGGGMFLEGNTTVETTSARINANAATSTGGGIHMALSKVGDAPTLTMEGPVDEDGCVGAVDWLVPIADRHCSEVRANTATNKGGGLIMQGGTATIDGTAFMKNGSTKGMAVYLQDGDQPELSLTNVLVAQHNGVGNHKVLVAKDDTTLDIDSSTITDNGVATVRYTENAQGSLRRSILWGTDLIVEGTNTLSATCSSLDGVTGTVFDAVTGIDPLFVTTARGQYRISGISPMVDQCSFGPDHDLDDDYRPIDLPPLDLFGPHHDRGAFEARW